MLAIPLRADAEVRALEPHHAAEFLAHQDRARAHISPWVGASFVVSDLDGAREVLRRYAGGAAADERRLYGIWLDGVLVGGAMFVSFDTASGACEVGCWLEPAAEGNGLIAQVVRLMLDWAFGERGMARADWRTLPDNVRSINVAERLGMTRQDEQLWAVTADEWTASSRAPGQDAAIKAELDGLMRTCLDAFTNTGGRAPNVGVIRDLFIPQGMIISNAGPEPLVHDLESFIAPRERMLTDGTLTEFSEWEVASRTEILGSVAQRFSVYEKSGIRDGERFHTRGRKTTQFVRTPKGWRMSSMAWNDLP
ncbi:GNAT family N-acetyltransferase [Actinomadura rupiterrae]|uniref:GNAT family N-acetyltransferase n=1 Tax=Actinomadura rupiterrae TaxID=559627 RepID=UPI0020A2E4F4|nr:GNAT family protein [Actinomadura rupiterrae]MCP2334897.1 RimJ/RimL family protein N-acetyltransferase [Actinomadura rupiterrae]